MSAPWVAFYSVRGGVGRSTTLTLVALELARRGRRVAVVDFDLESPGLDVLMTRDNARSHEGAQPGVVDFLDARARGKDFRVDDIIVPLDLPGDYTGRLFLVPAGRCDDRYLEALDRLDLKQMYERSGLLNPVRQLRVELEATLDPDVVLIDSRTGYSDAALVTLFDLADAAVIIMVPDLQNVERLAPVLQRLVRSERKPELLLVANKCQLTPPAWRAVANIEMRLRELVPVTEEDVDEVESPFLYKLPFLSEFTWIQRLLPPPVPSDALRQLARRVDTLVEAQAQPLTLIPKPPLSSVSLARRKELLERLRFGQPAAQLDDRLFDAFVPTRNVKEALKPDRWLVRGARGSGRTALFRLLAERPFEASGYCPALEDWRVIPAFGAVSLFQGAIGSSDLSLHFTKKVLRTTHSTWEGFWRLNAVGQAMRAQPALATTELRREAAALANASFPEYGEHLGKCLAKGSRIWADEFKSIAPKESSPGLMFVYDNIHLEDSSPDEEAVLDPLRGLINIWKPDATLALNGRMVPKILMREDIFNSLSSEVSLQPWRLHDVQLRWEVGEIAVCIVNRAKVEAKIRDYLREYEGALHQLPSGETRDFAVLFDERVGVGDRRARTLQMAARRLVDADGGLFPSDFIHMAVMAQALEKQDPSLARSFEPALIAGKHLLKALAQASNERARHLKWLLREYFDQEAFPKCLAGLHSPFYEKELLSRLVTAAVEPERPERTRREIAQQVLLRLKRLGVVGEWADGRLFVAELYLQGLGMHRAGLKALQDDTPPTSDPI